MNLNCIKTPSLLHFPPYSLAENIEYDKSRTEYLNTLVYKVIRFWNNEIYENIEGVVLRLKKEINPHQEH